VSRNDINTSASASPSSSVAQPLLSSQPQARNHGSLLLLPDGVPPAPAAAPNRTAPPLNRAPPPLNRAPPPSMSSTGLLSAAALATSAPEIRRPHRRLHLLLLHRRATYFSPGGVNDGLPVPRGAALRDRRGRGPCAAGRTAETERAAGKEAEDFFTGI
jgi:hypothetical protein